MRLGLAILAGALAAQEPLVRISVQLVQVDAVVTDKNGKIVRNLEQGDFEVLQDGKPVRINKFSFVEAGLPGYKAPLGPRTAAALKPEQVRRTVVVLVDDLGLSFSAMAGVRDGLKKFIDRQLQPNDLVAILRTGSGSGAFENFTTNREQLRAAAERLKWNPFSRTGVGRFAAAGDEDDADETIDNVRDEHFSMGSLGALEHVVRGLQQMPGRKSVVLISESLRLFLQDGSPARAMEMLRRLADQASRSGVVIYSIDPQGLAVTSMSAADRGPARASAREDLEFKRQEGLNYIALETGGLFYRHSNFIEEPLQQALDDQSGYYLLGYSPTEATFNRQFHKIQVKVKKPGLTVRSRNGFFGIEEKTQPVVKPKTMQEQLFRAIHSPFQASDLKLKLTTLYGVDGEAGARVNCMLHINMDGITVSAPDKDGWQTGRIDVLVMAFGEAGTQVDQTFKTYNMRIRGESLELARKNGLLFQVGYEVKKPGPYQVRVAVRDAVSEKLGTASQFLSAPDLSKGRLAVSSIVLGGRQKENEETPAATAKSNAAMRTFQPGQELAYGIQILNAKPEAASGRPKLLTQLRILENGAKIYEGKPVALPVNDQTDPKRMFAGGALKLGSKMKPGEYVLQFEVRDEVAGKKAVASQWMDFVVEP